MEYEPIQTIKEDEKEESIVSPDIPIGRKLDIQKLNLGDIGSTALKMPHRRLSNRVDERKARQKDRSNFEGGSSSNKSESEDPDQSPVIAEQIV